MALVDRCIFLAAAGGTADFTVAGAVTGYQTPLAAGASDTFTYGYAAQSSDLSQWEVGVSTCASSATVFQRTTILFSTNGNAKVNFTAAPSVLLTPLATDFLAGGGARFLIAS